MELREVMGTSMSSHSATKKSASPTDLSFQNLMNQKSNVQTPANHENATNPRTKTTGQKSESFAVKGRESSGNYKDAANEAMRSTTREEHVASASNAAQDQVSGEEDVKAEIAEVKTESTKDVTTESEEIQAEAENLISRDEDADLLLASVLGATEATIISETEMDVVVEAGHEKPSEVETKLSAETVVFAVADQMKLDEDVQVTIVASEEKFLDKSVSNGADIRRDWNSEKVLELLDIHPDQVVVGEETTLIEERVTQVEDAKELFLKSEQASNGMPEKSENVVLNKVHPRLYPAIEVSKEEASFEEAVGLKADVVIQPRSEVQVHFEQMTSNVSRPVMTQVTDAVRANFATLATGQVVEIQLSPEQLGKVELKLHIHKGVIEAEIKVENQQVKSAIESSMAELKQSLSQRGYEVKDVAVNVDSDGHREGSQNGGRQEQREDAESAGFVELLEEEARKAKE